MWAGRSEYSWPKLPQQSGLTASHRRAISQGQASESGPLGIVEESDDKEDVKPAVAEMHRGLSNEWCESIRDGTFGMFEMAMMTELIDASIGSCSMKQPEKYRSTFLCHVSAETDVYRWCNHLNAR